VAFGIGLADRLVVGFDPGVGGEGVGAYAGTPRRPDTAGPTQQYGGDGALQAVVPRATQAYGYDFIAGIPHVFGGGRRRPAPGEFQHGAQPYGFEPSEQPGDADGQQRQQAAAQRQEAAALEGNGHGHEVTTSSALHNW
jgi:hypothetical protein